MGCCQSTNAEDENGAPRATQAGPPRGRVADPINSSQAAINRPASDVGSPRPSSSVPNKRIRPPTPVAKSPGNIPQLPPPWTRSQLANRRKEYFETRLTGSPEVWNALMVVCEELRQGNVEQAQAVLDAADLTCPNGRVAIGRGSDRKKGGVYDSRGTLYELPPWVVTDPQDLLEDEEKDVEGGADDDSEDEDSAAAIAARERRRDEKGKGRAEDTGEIYRVRARLSDRATDVLVEVGSKQKVAVIVRRIQEQIGAKRVRLMYLGKTLDEQKTLEQQNWTPGNVINAMVFEGDETMLISKATSK